MSERSSLDAVIEVYKAGLDRSQVTIDIVGASVGPHVGPGCVGGVALYKS